MSENELAYKPLGAKLKALRVGRSETIAEVSGAVEIDEKTLQRIESGQERPSEDVLLLLISHFSIRDDKAAELWRLAGYDKVKDGEDGGQQAVRNTMMVMIDPRVMYSDAVEVTADEQGVVVNFFQKNGLGNDQPLAVSRIGMSHKQAKLVMAMLHQALYELDNPKKPRQLGDGHTE
jgi:transcriptional regulator with XRE-family HTH domain